jgi:hypothetical protein
MSFRRSVFISFVGKNGFNLFDIDTAYRYCKIMVCKDWRRNTKLKIEQCVWARRFSVFIHVISRT